MLRRRYLSLAVAMAGLAGCTSEDEPQPVTDTQTPTDSSGSQSTQTETSTSKDESSASKTAEAVVGEVVRGDTLAMVIRNVRKTEEIGEFQEADSGNTFVIVRMAVKNVTQNEYLNFSSFFQTTLRDDEDYSYNATFAVTDQTLASGQLVPGEVT